MPNALSFTRATKEQGRLRLGLVGVSGSGKTYTSLLVASGLGERVALLDTEHGSASKYADEFEFDTLAITSFNPKVYIDAIHAADQAGYDVFIIDSLSHAWAGKDGALQMADDIAARSTSRNSYFAWRDVTPLHHQLIDTILASPMHIIATMRAKTEYVIETDERGKQVPRKIGMAPVQRQGMEYEFDVVGDMHEGHKLVVSKSRCRAVADAVIREPGLEFAATLKAWLSSGEPRGEQAPAGDSHPTSGAASTPAPPAGPAQRIRQEISELSGDEKRRLFEAVVADAALIDVTPPVTRGAQALATHIAQHYGEQANVRIVLDELETSVLDAMRERHKASAVGGELAHANLGDVVQ